jgi:hypothetical protein
MKPACALVAACLALLAACTARFDWREVRQSQAGYVIALPDKPQSATREITFDHPSGPVQAELAMLSTGVGPTLFAVGTAKLPPSAIDSPPALAATLAWFRDGLLRNLQASGATPVDIGAPAGLGRRTLRAAQAIPAAAAVSNGRKARLAVRWYVIDDRLFQLVALGAEGEIPPQTLETFFDSFRLTP